MPGIQRSLWTLTAFLGRFGVTQTPFCHPPAECSEVRGIHDFRCRGSGLPGLAETFPGEVGTGSPSGNVSKEKMRALLFEK